jgi:uncharacterized membrane-anchored protein
MYLRTVRGETLMPSLISSLFAILSSRMFRKLKLQNINRSEVRFVISIDKFTVSGTILCCPAWLYFHKFFDEFRSCWGETERNEIINHSAKNDLSKVPAVTLTFWVIKILATTLGETGGDAVSMSMNLGYVIASIIFIGIFAAVVVAQVSAKSFHPMLYWAVIIATTTLGTTFADFADRSLGIGYSGGSSLLFILLMASLGIWYKSAGSISVNTITSPKVEMFYWITVLFSQTLGTALGDWMADTNRLGYEGGALVFGAGLALVAAGYFFTSVSRTVLFWAAFILTRPLGATLGDLLDKPVDRGGFAFSRYTASGILAALIIACILFLPQKAGSHPGQIQRAS